jgi:tetratricopeptide (TPR) repeat protein
MLLAALLTIAVVMLHRRGKVGVVTVGSMLIGGVLLIGWVGESEAVRDRLASLLDLEAVSTEGRVANWRDALAAAPDFWLLGSGLGTYRFVYGRHQERLADKWFYHAENQYLEALINGGVLGLGLLLALFGLVAWAVWRLLRADERSRTRAFAVAGVFALASQAMQAAADFGLYIPSNLFLFSLICGGLAGRAAKTPVASRRHRARTSRWPTLPSARALGAPLAAALLLAGLWAGGEMHALARVETAVQRSQFEDPPASVSAERVTASLQDLTTALQGRPDDAEGHWRTADLWMHLYRLRAMEALRADAEAMQVDDETLWLFTAPAQIHGRAHHFAREGLVQELDDLRREPVIQDHLIPALKHAVMARQACPLLPQPHLQIAKLGVLVADPGTDRQHLDRLRRLAPAEPGLLFECGLLELNAGRADVACAVWRRSLELSPEYEQQIWAAAQERLTSEEILEGVVPRSPADLLRFARTYYANEPPQLGREKLLQLGLDQLDRTAAAGGVPPEETHQLRAGMYALLGQKDRAAAEYERAVALQPSRAEWRYELARLLLDIGQPDRALPHARWCAARDLRSSKYRKLLEDIHEARLRR